MVYRENIDLETLFARMKQILVKKDTTMSKLFLKIFGGGKNYTTMTQMKIDQGLDDYIKNGKSF